MIRFDSVAFSGVVDALTCFVCYAFCVCCVVYVLYVENERVSSARISDVGYLV